jgi:hypothetical protein
MVKRRKTPESLEEVAKANVGKSGRPFQDPADKRTVRVAIRAHPDLMHECDKLARQEGLVRSVFIERVLGAYVNMFYQCELVDSIGRYVPEEIRDGVGTSPTALGRLRSGQAWHTATTLRPPKPGR